MIGYGAQQPPFVDGGIGQHGQGLVRVSRDHDMVENLGDAPVVLDGHAARPPRDGPGAGIQDDAIGVGRRQPPDIFAAAAGNGTPLRPVGELEQTMVLEEPDELAERMSTHAVGRRRPDGGRHRQKVMVQERLGIAVLVEIGAKRQCFGGVILEQPRSLGVETPDVAQHAPEAGPECIGLLGEQAAQIGARIFQRTAIGGNGERHVAGLRRDVQMPEQGDQIGIGLLVIHDEAGIDRYRAGRTVGLHGVGVTADPALAFENRDLMALAEKPGRRHAGDAGADDGDL